MNRKTSHNTNSKYFYYKIYVAAHNNAVGLLSSAEKLIKDGDHPSAYVLAYTALEEIAKSQRAADTFTDFAKMGELQTVSCNHKLKRIWAEWVALDALEGLCDEDGNLIFIDPKIVSFKNRNLALYVNFNSDQIIKPEDVITEAVAESMIHVVRGAIDQIMIKEFMGEPIGTKGFMK